MATETTLNHVVKGAPPPQTKIPPPAPLPSLSQASSHVVAGTGSASGTGASDKRGSVSVDLAVNSLPSSPPQIYLNLLILEASLRSQYLQLLTRRRLNTFFLLILACWNIGFTYALFLRPREDGTGLGGSPYWVVEAGIRLAFIGGWIAALLVRATGQWDRGIRWPRKWLGTTNRGLRGFNLRVAIIRGSFWQEVWGHISSVIPISLLWQDIILGALSSSKSSAGAGTSHSSTTSGDWHLIESGDGRIIEEDLAKGGNHVMLLLLPKNFSSEFRENWETYRTEYWYRENDRRATLRTKMKTQRRNKAKEAGGWRWWTGFWRISALTNQQRHLQQRLLQQQHIQAYGRKHHDLEKNSQHSSSRHSTVTDKDGAAAAAFSNKPGNQRRSLMRSESSHSRQSSRSTTPHMDSDGVEGVGSNARHEGIRRGSSVSSTSSIRKSLRRDRKVAGDGSGPGTLTPMTATDQNDTSRGVGVVVHDPRAHSSKKEREDRPKRLKKSGASFSLVRGGSSSDGGGGSANNSPPDTPNLELLDPIVRREPFSKPS